MKKILSLVLVLGMLLSACLMFSSCDAVSESNVTEKPTETLSTAMENTYSSFVEGGTGLFDIIQKADKKSSFKVYLESDTLLGGKLTEVDATFYTDADKKNSAIDVNAVVDDDKMSGLVFVDKAGVIANSQSFFGNKKSYGIFFDTFIEEFPTSDLADMMELTGSEAKEIVKIITDAKAEMEKTAKENAEKYNKICDAMFKELNLSVAAAKEKVEGKDVDCVVVTYEIDNKAIKSALLSLYDDVLAELDTDGEIKASILEACTEMNEDFDIDLKMDIALVKKTNKIASVAITGDVADPDNKNNKFDVDVLMQFTDKEISLSGSIKESSSNMTYSADLTIGKKSNDKGTTYDVSLTVGMGTAKVDIFEAELNFNKNGKFDISIDITEEPGAQPLTVEVSGEYEITGTSAKFEFNSVKAAGTTIDDFKFGFVIDSAPTFPEQPNREDVEDVIEFTEKDWEMLVTEIKNSDLGSIIY